MGASSGGSPPDDGWGKVTVRPGRTGIRETA
jgi:hypothetical protein